MIDFVTGKLASRTLTHAVVDVGGVGLKLAMTAPALAALPALGDTVTVFAHLHVREDELSLFGFTSAAEKSAFEQLITVSGVGPKVALATLSSLTPEALALAVEAGDLSALSAVPGVGKKTAQRMILDLAGRLVGTDGSAGPQSAATPMGEATDALLGMGFSASEIAVALRDAPATADAGALVRIALRTLGGRG